MSEITGNMPVELELPPIKPGANWEWTFYITNDNDEPLNTTGYAFVMTGKNRINGEKVFEISTANGKCVMTAAQGRFTNKLTPADTAQIDVQNVVWDCLLKDAGGVVTPLFQGIEIPIRVLHALTPPF